MKMIFMSNFLKNEIVLIKYPFSDLTVFKVRPAIIVSSDYPSNDVIIVPLTSRLIGRLPGEFSLAMWREAGLNVQSTVKRGFFTIDEKLVIQRIGKLHQTDFVELDKSIQCWLGLEN